MSRNATSKPIFAVHITREFNGERCFFARRRCIWAKQYSSACRTSLVGERASRWRRAGQTHLPLTSRGPRQILPVATLALLRHHISERRCAMETELACISRRNSQLLHARSPLAKLASVHLGQELKDTAVVSSMSYRFSATTKQTLLPSYWRVQDPQKTLLQTVLGVQLCQVKAHRIFADHVAAHGVSGTLCCSGDVMQFQAPFIPTAPICYAGQHKNTLALDRSKCSNEFLNKNSMSKEIDLEHPIEAINRDWFKAKWCWCHSRIAKDPMNVWHDGTYFAWSPYNTAEIGQIDSNAMHK